MRTVVIVLLDPVGDALPGLLEVLVLVEPHLLFFQAAMKPFDVAVALGMAVGGAPVRDALLAYMLLWTSLISAVLTDQNS